MSNWLKSYFQPIDRANLNPEIVEEGKRYAIVKIQDMSQKGGFSKIGYILVKKDGAYRVTKHESLFEGTPSLQDLFQMKNRLIKSESA